MVDCIWCDKERIFLYIPVLVVCRHKRDGTEVDRSMAAAMCVMSDVPIALGVCLRTRR